MTTQDLIDTCTASPLGQQPLARFLAERGTRMSGAALPPGRRPGVPREAFRNAWDLSLSGRYQYWEGYAWHPDCGILPFHHAWGVEPETGRVHDVTWPDAAAAIYLGVHVPKDILLENLARTEVFGILDKGHGLERETIKAVWGWVQPALSAQVEPARTRPTCPVETTG